MQEPIEVSPSDVGDTLPADQGDDQGEMPSAVPPTDDNKETAVNRELAELKARSERNYARAKAAEEKLKEYRSKDELPKQSQPPQANTQHDPIELAKAVKALSQFDEAELNLAQKIAKADGISPLEAVKTEEFKMFSEGKRAKDLRDNKIPKPASGGGQGQGLPDGDSIGKMSDADHARLEREFKQRQTIGRGV
jgi:hypothetical protein